MSLSYCGGKHMSIADFLEDIAYRKLEFQHKTEYVACSCDGTSVERIEENKNNIVLYLENGLEILIELSGIEFINVIEDTYRVALKNSDKLIFRRT